MTYISTSNQEKTKNVNTDSQLFGDKGDFLIYLMNCKSWGGLSYSSADVVKFLCSHRRISEKSRRLGKRTIIEIIMKLWKHLVEKIFFKL